MNQKANYSKPTFGANFINKVNIQQFDKQTNAYRPVEASFVEFESKNRKDLDAMVKAVRSWQGDEYAATIVENAFVLDECKEYGENSHVYILTKQLDDFGNLNAKKILGLAQVQEAGLEPDSDYIRYLQVRPNTKYGMSKRLHKNVGEEIVNSLKKIYSKSIELCASYSAANFYEKQGFELIDKDSLRFVWKNKRLR